MIHATSNDLFGPYEFREVVLTPRPDDWDSEGIHNPKVTKAKNRFLLYYLGIPAWKTGFAWSDTIKGPWKRSDTWKIPTNNPAIWIHENGRVYCVGKRRSPLVPNVRPWTNWMEAFSAPEIDGEYEPVGDTNKSRLPNNYELEDPTIWYDCSRYHVILVDWKGLASGVRQAGLHYSSTDGIDYELVSSTPLFSRSLEVDSGTMELAKRERPQIVVDRSNRPVALCTACQQQEGEAFIAVTPIKTG